MASPVQTTGAAEWRRGRGIGSLPVSAVDGGTNAALRGEIALDLEPAREACGNGGLGLLARSQAVEELPVAFLGRAEVVEQGPQLGVVAGRMEEREALAATRFDERSD